MRWNDDDDGTSLVVLLFASYLYTAIQWSCFRSIAPYSSAFFPASMILYPILRNLSSFFISFTLDVKEPLSSPPHKYMRRSIVGGTGQNDRSDPKTKMDVRNKRGDQWDGMNKRGKKRGMREGGTRSSR